MRFVWAVVAFVLAALLIGLGIAQRTVFLGPTTSQREISISEELPYTVVDGAVLTSHEGAQTLLAQGEGAIFAAYGRTADVQAWLSDVRHNAVTVDAEGELSVEVVEPSVVDPDADPAAPGRNPVGSDLWLDEFTQEDRLIAKLQLPEDMSVLIAADGTAPAPSVLQVSWPIQNATPWAGPLMVLGGIVMAVGILLYILAIRHARRSRGPRRKGLPPLPETQPLDTIEAAEAKGVISQGGSGRRALGSRRRTFAVIPVAALTLAALTGCSPEAWPQLGESPSPSASPSVVAQDDMQPPAVTEKQADRILQRAAAVVAEADAAADADLAATRLGGAVLEERTANYTIRGKVEGYEALPAIPTRSEGFTLPQAVEGWPRSVMMVVSPEPVATPEPVETEAAEATDEASAPAAEETAEPAPIASPTVLVMTQDDAWSDYRITYLANLAAATVLPDVAGATIGAVQVPGETPFLVLSPDELAAAYADVLNKGAESEFASRFQEDGDQFRVKVAEDRKARLDTFNETGAETGSLTFSSAAGAHAPFALATLESGAIVAVSMVETDTVKPTNEEAVIKLDGNPTVQALAGTSSSPTGFNTNYSDQLFFYVPSEASGAQIQLLGYGSNIVSAGVIE